MDVWGPRKKVPHGKLGAPTIEVTHGHLEDQQDRVTDGRQGAQKNRVAHGRLGNYYKQVHEWTPKGSHSVRSLREVLREHPWRSISPRSTPRGVNIVSQT